jgi:hypothetical protein
MRKWPQTTIEKILYQCLGAIEEPIYGSSIIGRKMQSNDTIILI